MSMTPARDGAICGVCGELRQGGCHACPGPKIVYQGPAVLAVIPGNDCGGGCGCHGAPGSAICGTCCSGEEPQGHPCLCPQCGQRADRIWIGNAEAGLMTLCCAAGHNWPRPAGSAVAGPGPAQRAGGS